MGTLVGIPFALALASLPCWLGALLVGVSIFFGAWACDVAAATTGDKDPGWIVLDEMVGFWVATLWLAPSLWSYIVAFGLFRLFDILKPPPVGWLDRNVTGGWGILLDDVAAGVMARLVLLMMVWMGLL